MKVELVLSVLGKAGQFRIFLLILFFGSFIVDVFFIKTENSYTDWISDLRLFLPLILWILIVKVFRFSGFETLKLTLFFLSVLSLIFILFRNNSYTERLASWVYIYLASGVIQQLFEVRRK